MPLFKKAVANGRPLVQLSEVHRRVLRRCRMILIKDLNPTDILESLTVEDGFKQDVKDSILGLWSADKQVGAILDHLETQSDETFGVFMDILRERYKHVHCVLEETARTLDETEDYQMRERAAIVGDSVRKLLRHTARRQMQDQTRRGSSESPGEYYIDNLRNDADDIGQYIDCYIIPTKGKLQKEKWIKHVTMNVDHETPAVKASARGTMFEIVLKSDLVFRLIDRSEIPEGVEQPPKLCTCVYVIKRDDKKELMESVQEADVAEKKTDSEDALEKQKVPEVLQTEKVNNRPPPLPPKPQIINVSGKKIVTYLTSSTPVVAGESSEQKLKQAVDIQTPLMPPLPMRKPQAKPENGSSSINHKKDDGLQNGEVPVMNGTVESDDDEEDDDDGDDDDEEDTISLNYDVGIEEDDATDELVSLPSQKDSVSPNTNRNLSHLSSTKSTLTSEGQTIGSPISELSGSVFNDVTPNGRRTVWQDGQNMPLLRRLESSSLDQQVLPDMLNSADCSHYEEIEPLGGSLRSGSGIYLDPHLDQYMFERHGSRYKDHRNRTLNGFANHLKTLASPNDMILNKGTLLIVKRKDEIVAQHPDFAKTFLGYDHMGFAYYVPVDSVRRYGDPRNEKWFYPIEMTARESTLFLSSVNQKGCFVIYQPARRMESSPAYCLSVSLGNGDVLHYNIIENIHGDVMIQDHDHSFMNVCELVEYFQKNQSNLATRLRRPLKEANLPIIPGYHYDSRFEIPRHEIELSRFIVEKGTFSDYHVAAFKRSSVKVSVMKTEPSSTNDDDFLDEALTMMLTDHENIIRFIGVSCRARPFYIVMEHIDRGTLSDCLQDNIIPSDNIDSLFSICIQLVAAMCYLESLCFVLHRNLAAKSFYVTSDFLVKLGKFSQARHVLDDNYQAPLSEEVMVRWAAPEVLMCSTYSTKSDVWSLGVVFWEVFSQGACPYSSLGVEQVAVYVTEGGKLDKPPGCAPDLWAMMKSCWKQFPNDRPTFAMLQDKIKGKSSIYYVSPVRNHLSNMSVKSSVVLESTKHNGFVPGKNKSSNPMKLTGSASKMVSDVSKNFNSLTNSRKKRSQSASRGTRDRVNQDDNEGRGKRANSVVRNSCERARTPSSDSSSLVSASIANDSCDELERGQKSRKSWKKLLK